MNPLVLPFQVHSEDGVDGRAMADAMSFLISSRLDWLPGCYSQRHAYFVFKRDIETMGCLSAAYDEAVIAEAIKGWSATHAVGGTLDVSRAGIKGELRIFDPKGKCVYKNTYGSPRDLAKLVCDMTEDAMVFFGAKPSPALSKFLHVKRWEHDESILDLGAAAWKEERTPSEFDLYEKVLKRDPGFAEVRFWYANQRGWADGDDRRASLEMGKALTSYPVRQALDEFVPVRCPDPDLAAKYPEWLKQAEELVGEDHPVIVIPRVNEALVRRQIDPVFREKAMRVAALQPNNYGLLLRLAAIYRLGNQAGTDYDMAASLDFAALQSRLMPGSGLKIDAAADLAANAKDLGMYSLCLEFAKPLCAMTDEKAPDCFRYAEMACDALHLMARYSEALPYCARLINTAKTPDERLQGLFFMAVDGAMSGRADILDRVIEGSKEESARTNSRFILDGFRDALAGKPIDLPAMRQQIDRTPLREIAWFLVAQLEIPAGEQTQRKETAAFVSLNPNDRQGWIVLDAYDRMEPKAESACFYDALEWLHSDDPWVQKAVAAYRERAGKSPAGAPPGADELIKQLQEFKPVRWPPRDPQSPHAADVLKAIPPGAPDAAIRKLLAEGNFDKARELALRIHAAAALAHAHPAAIYENHMIYRIEQAQAKAKATPAAKP